MITTNNNNNNNNNSNRHILDIGILQIGAQNVPLYPTLSKKDYTYVVNYSDEKYCFISDAGLYEKVWKVQDQTPLKNSYS